MSVRNKITTILAVIFGIGFVWIVYTGRPVMNLKDTSVPAVNTFTMADVAAHNTQASCWSAINGSVYDLTDWISRHPGGPGAIIGLCGTDGSDDFYMHHGTSRSAQAALVLFKIGTLK